jgi:Fe-S oxidoreductase
MIAPTHLITMLAFLMALGLSGWLFWKEVKLRLDAINKLDGDWPKDHPERRWLRVISEVLFQSKVIRNRPVAGLAHALVFWAFLAFGLETLNHLSMIFIPAGFLPTDGLFHTLFQGFVAIFAWSASAGILYLAFRRFVLRPKSLGEQLSWTSGLVAVFILVLMQTYLIKFYGCLVGQPQAQLFNWLLHTVVLLVFVVLVPRSKHLHLVLGPFAVWFRPEQPGHILPLDFEKEEMGTTQLKELPKSNALSVFACVECGRCMDHCPANATGKALNPKELVLKMRQGFLEDSSQEAIAEGQIVEDWLWQCTTCGACAEQCPVGNDQPATILEFRRGKTSEGEFPETLRTLFDNLERSGNPWRYPASEAHTFLRENEIPTSDGSQKVLYWMGCMARHDEAYRKVALDFVAIMKAAGVDFAVLKNEKCTGDAARRAGNEFAFQELAMENSEIINKAAPELIVSTCPHCLKSLEEYKDMPEDMRMNNIPVMHHSQFIRQLIDEGRIELNNETVSQMGQMTYHDACYLSRYIGDEVIDAPRETLRASGAKLSEAKRHGRDSFCCGAGGAQLFMEETEGKRINTERTEELLDTGSSTLCTSCPFCKTMIQDSVTDVGQKGVQVLDIAQIVAKALKS